MKIVKNLLIVLGFVLFFAALSFFIWFSRRVPDNPP